MLIKAQGEPEEALEGQGEIEMSEANPDLVQKQLSELAQRAIHLVQASNKEKEILEDEFESFRPNIEILETRIHTDRH